MKNTIEVEGNVINVKYIVSYSNWKIVTVNSVISTDLTKDEITKLIYPNLEEFGSVSMRINGSDLNF